MPIGSGLGAQIGYATEATPGTYLAPTRTIPLVSESMSLDVGRIESKAIRADRRVMSRWAPGRHTIEGTVEHELVAEQTGLLLRHAFGAVATTGSSPNFTHTFTPGPLVATSSLTAQVVRPGVGGASNVFSYVGAHVKKWTISGKVDEIAMISLDLWARKEDTAQTAVAPADAATWTPFVYTGTTLSIAGSVFPCDEFSIEGDNGLDTESRHKMSGAGSQWAGPAVESGLRSITGTVTADFIDLTAYNRYVNGTEAALVLAFTNGTRSLTFTLNVRFDGTTPNVGGPDLLKIELPFTALSTTSDAAAITGVLVNGDSAP